MGRESILAINAAESPLALIKQAFQNPPPVRDGGFWKTEPERLIYHDRWYGITAVLTPLTDIMWNTELYDIQHRGNELLPHIVSEETFYLHAAVTLADSPGPDYRTVIPVELLERRSWEDKGLLLCKEMERQVEKTIRDYRFRDLHARIPGLYFTEAGGAAPYKAEGTWGDHTFRFRYRHGTATLDVSTDSNDEPYMYSINYGDDGNYPRWSATVSYGHEYGGVLTDTEFIYLFCLLGSQLGPAPYQYHFLRPDTASEQNTFSSTLIGIGHTVEEARHDAYRREIEFLMEDFSDKPDYTPSDLTTDMEDTRVFPPKPPFTVLSIPDVPHARP